MKKTLKAKFCGVCGEVFFTRSESRTCCSDKCKRKVVEMRREEYGQLCWRCKNACGGCSWSRNKTPIKGWDAEPDIVKDKEGYFHSYKIKNCPEFIKG